MKTAEERRRIRLASVPWSRAEDDLITRAAESGEVKAAAVKRIAAETGRTRSAVEARARAIRAQWLAVMEGNSGRIRRAERTWHRRCLMCRNWWDAPARYRFVCDICHQSERWTGYPAEFSIGEAE